MHCPGRITADMRMHAVMYGIYPQILDVTLVPDLHVCNKYKYAWTAISQQQDQNLP